jgi:hypothetical protein
MIMFWKFNNMLHVILINLSKGQQEMSKE